MSESPTDLTRLLVDWSDGDAGARDRMMPLVLDELRRMARGLLAGERVGHTLQPTALVNEVYLRLFDLRQVNWSKRAQFFGFAAELMRRVLIDHAREQKAKKRGGDQIKTSLTAAFGLAEDRAVDLLALDAALFDLARFDPEGSRIVEMRYFGGMTIEEVAEVLGLGTTTVKRKWRHATTWLYRQLVVEPPEAAP
ncbi:MAG: sigma-70 family RNA polymerase sigma factor [Acidobacteriota bacterium]